MTRDVSLTDRLLVDTNLLVLFVVGQVNRKLIESFKRTSKYRKEDFDLLVNVLGHSKSVHTIPHVLAEVSNLSDLSGKEKARAREILKQTISNFTEVASSSLSATQQAAYSQLGLVDAAIVMMAQAHKCTVLTDDLDLYLRLQRDIVGAVNFTHLRAQSLGV